MAAKRAYLITVFLLIITAALVNFLEYGTYYKAEVGIKALEGIPLRMGEWVGRDVHLDEQIYRILETRSIIHRVYSAPGNEVLLSIVYYPETKVDFHAPESCLGGKGIKIEKSPRRISFSNEGKKLEVELNQLLWDQGPDKTLVYYFYKAGDFVGNSYLRLRLALAANKVVSNNKSGSLIRISTSNQPGEENRSAEVLAEFMGELYPHVLKSL